MPFIGERPLIHGEDPRVYDGLFCRFAAAVEPADPVEWLWVKDLVDAAWEAQRARRLRAQLFNIWRKSAIEKLVESCLDDGSIMDPYTLSRGIAHDWTSTGARGEREMEKLLAEYGLSPDVVHATVLGTHARSFERIDSMIAAADQRRDKIIQEIERRRRDRASPFRRAADDIVDVDPDQDKLAGKQLGRRNG